MNGKMILQNAQSREELVYNMLPEEVVDKI